MAVRVQVPPAVHNRKLYRIIDTMSKMSKCAVLGLQAQNGNRVSHSRRHAKCMREVNSRQRVLFSEEQKCLYRLPISNHGLRIVNKLGLDGALRKMWRKKVENL